MPRKVNLSRYKKGDILAHDGTQFYTVHDVRNLEYKGKAIRDYIKDNERMHNSYDILEALLNKLKYDLKTFLTSVTGLEQNGDLNELVKLLKTLLVINENEDYELYTFDDDGYINGITDLYGRILKKQDLPYDILNGYYTIKDNKIVKDDVRYNQLYNQL